MKPIRVILLVAVVVAGLLVLLGIAQLTRLRDVEAFRVEREALRRETVERATVARGLAGPQGADEARATVRWWFDALAALEKRLPRAAKGADDRAAPQSTLSDAAAWNQYAGERLQVLRDGYTPLLSAVDQGLRLDVLSIRAAEHPETHERRVRIDFALWGVPRRIDAEVTGIALARPTMHVVVPIAFRELSFQFVDNAGKAWGKMTGSGEPYRMLKDPERFSAQMPPGIVLGTWWVERFPHEAERVEISAVAQVQGMSAGSLTATFRWETAVADDWRLGAGETFNAQTLEVPAEPKSAHK